jgi:myo-inositol catabolism protein IolC
MDYQPGYDKPIYMLAFDHRASFSHDILHVEGQPSEYEAEKVREMKGMIFDAFEQAVGKGVSKSGAAILSDEQFGSEVLKRAHDGHFAFAVCTEKSGQKEFVFEHGEGFGQKLLEIQPTFAKALVRYNPEDDAGLNQRQLERLKQLSDFCHQNGIKLLVEPLVLATQTQLSGVGGDQTKYDHELRPKLMVEMVKQFQMAGVETDVWKIEGLEKTEEYEAVVRQARVGGRDGVIAVVLGRGADDKQVEDWLRAAAKAKGVEGFAIGRTIFHDALVAYVKNDLTKEQAVEAIAEKYWHFYQIFLQNK